MRGTRTGWIASVLLAGSVGVLACGSNGPTSGGAVDRRGSLSSADTLDVSSGSRVSLAVHGGLGPLVSGQTITKASLTLSNLQLVDDGGNAVALSSDPYTADLVSLQDKLGQIFSKHALQDGSYTALQFQLNRAWVEAHDAHGHATVYASPGVDPSQFSGSPSMQTLRFSGVDADDYVTCGLPDGGIAVSGTSSLVVQFALAQSVKPQKGGTWELAPKCWVVERSTFSTLDVDFDVDTADGGASGAQDWSKGFEVMLLDSSLYPVSEERLVAHGPSGYRAHFPYLQSFQGPFVAALLPPAGDSLQSSVAFSVDVQEGASVTASVHVSSFDVSGHSFAIGTGEQCQVEQRDAHGHVLSQKSEPIGVLQDVAPKTRTPLPQLPGNPPPKKEHGHGKPASTSDAGSTPG